MDIEQKEEIERLKFDGIFYGYYAKAMLGNGQTISIFFIQNRTSRDVEYYVTLLIANKKKHIKDWITGVRDVLSDKSTGTCGLEGLLWAKRKLTEFEGYLQHQYRNSKSGKITIVIHPTDTRRKKVYLHGLKKLGYELGYRSSVQCLYKKIA